MLACSAKLERQTSFREKGSLSFRAGEKGDASVHGPGRFPMAFFSERRVRLLGKATEFHSFLERNRSKLKLKDPAP